MNDTGSSRKLVRGLTLTDSTSIVICSIIGTGVFLKCAVMAQYLGTPMLVMAAWLAAGVLSLAGALTYAELGAMFPEAGGDYVFLRAAYGDAPAFLYGWMYITAGASGAAALAAAFATFLAAVAPIGDVWAAQTFHVFGHELLWRFGMRQIVAIAAILSCALFNCAGVAYSGRLQTVFTATKMLGVVVIVAGVFFFSESVSWEHLRAPSGSPVWSGTKAFGAAMLAALWAYNGWNFLPMVAGEVKNPGRTIPRALMIGSLSVLVVYLLANLAYFYSLPFGEVATSNSTAYRDALPVAAKAASTFIGPFGIKLISILFIVSTFGTLHSEILGIPRISYAMAHDGLFFPAFGRLGKRSRVPVFAIGFKAFLACVLASSGTFDQLTTLLIFSLWIFFGLTASSLFVLRRKQPDTPRPYRALGYPVVPFLFILAALWLVVNTLLTSPVESVFGLVIILPGLPLFYYFRRKRRAEESLLSDK